MCQWAKFFFARFRFRCRFRFWSILWTLDYNFGIFSWNSRVTPQFKEQKIERNQKKTPNLLTEGFSNSTVDNKVDGRIKNQEEVVERYQHQKCHRIRKSVHLLAKIEMVFRTLMRMKGLKNGKIWIYSRNLPSWLKDSRISMIFGFGLIPQINGQWESEYIYRVHLKSHRLMLIAFS